MSRGEDRSGISTLTEKMWALQTAYDFLKSAGETTIYIIGKSFGGIVVSHWLSEYGRDGEIDVSIMGYVPGEGNILTDSLRGRLRVVVRGEHDKYASPSQVMGELAAHHIDADVIEIANADHSYRDNSNINSAEYAFQDTAIDELLNDI